MKFKLYNENTKSWVKPQDEMKGDKLLFMWSNEDGLLSLVNNYDAGLVWVSEDKWGDCDISE